MTSFAFLLLIGIVFSSDTTTETPETTCIRITHVDGNHPELVSWSMMHYEGCYKNAEVGDDGPFECCGYYMGESVSVECQNTGGATDGNAYTLKFNDQIICGDLATSNDAMIANFMVDVYQEPEGAALGEACCDDSSTCTPEVNCSGRNVCLNAVCSDEFAQDGDQCCVTSDSSCTTYRNCDENLNCVATEDSQTGVCWPSTSTTTETWAIEQNDMCLEVSFVSSSCNPGHLLDDKTENGTCDQSKYTYDNCKDWEEFNMDGIRQITTLYQSTCDSPDDMTVFYGCGTCSLVTFMVMLLFILLN